MDIIKKVESLETLKCYLYKIIDDFKNGQINKNDANTVATLADKVIKIHLLQGMEERKKLKLKSNE